MSGAASVATSSVRLCAVGATRAPRADTARAPRRTRATPRGGARLAGAPPPKGQRLHVLVHAAAERLRRVGRCPSRPIELDDAVTAAERRERVQDALDARAHA